MTEATINSRRETSLGDDRVIIADVTWDNTDTFTTLYKAAEAYFFTPTTNASFGITSSAGVLTLVSGGALTGKLIVFIPGG